MKRKINMKTWILCLAVLAAVAGQAVADVITINPAAPTGNQDWNGALWGDPAAAPTSGNDYVSANKLVWLRSLGSYGSFNGDSLTLQSAASLFLSGSGSLGGTLILDGGSIQNRSAAGVDVVVSGSVRVDSLSDIGNFNEILELQTALSGSGDLKLLSYNGMNRQIVVGGTDGGFTGDFILRNAAYSNTAVAFNTSFTGAGLTFQGGDLAQAPIYQLTNDISFLTVSMPSATDVSVLVKLESGTYDAAALAAAGVHASYFSDLGGTITAIESVPPILMNSATATGNQDWNGAIWGDPAAVPTAGNDYVSTNKLVWLRALGTTYGSFNGDFLTLQSFASLFLSGSGNLGGTLNLDGGVIQNRSGMDAVVTGNIRVDSLSEIGNIGDNLELQTSLSGSGDLKVFNNTEANRRILFNGTDAGFTGTFILRNSTGTNFAVAFNTSYPGAGLTFEGGVLAKAPKYQLTNDISFLTVSMPSAANVSVPVDLAPGIYDAAALVAAGVHASYFSDLGGTITVGVPPAGYATWAAGWGEEIGSDAEDFDGDQLSNLAEYALGGDPTRIDDQGEVPTFGNVAGTMVYIHAQLKSDTSLVYYLETAEDLLSNSWTNSGYTVTGTNVMAEGDFNFVTNTIPMTDDETFVRLMIEK